jgi:orotidine-5'-phosphate decarboxylase
MKFTDKLNAASKKNNSLLCIGLDPDLRSLPEFFLRKVDPLFEFNRELILATSDLVCAYKPNIAFYEALGPGGIESLIKTIEFIPKEIPVILDAKRSDVSYTAKFYAKSIFTVFNADAVTVNPFLGFDSLRPFLDYHEKGIFILCLTSNKGSGDFQRLGKKPIYKLIAELTMEWNFHNNCGLVVGATNPNELKEIRNIAKNIPILIPGIGAQGGSLEKAVKFGTDKKGGNAILNVSRSIIYASKETNFASVARKRAFNYRDLINKVKSVVH